MAFKERHIGDGVYVSFDGYQFWLAVNDHRNKVIALEPGVLRQLVDCAREIDEEAKQSYFGV